MKVAKILQCQKSRLLALRRGLEYTEFSNVFLIPDVASIATAITGYWIIILSCDHHQGAPLD